MEAIFEQLLQAAREGDRRALELLLAGEQAWLQSRCERMLGPRCGHLQAEDLVQECNLRFLSRWDALDFESRPSLRAWLLTVARSVMINSGKRQWTSHESVPPELTDPDDAWSASEPLDAIHAARQSLSLRQDAAILLRDYLGCSFELIAEVLGCPTVVAARSLRARALNSIARRISRNGG